MALGIKYISFENVARFKYMAILFVRPGALSSGLNHCMITRRLVLPGIVIAQFLCTTLWFGGNAVADDLILNELDLPEKTIAWVISAVQFGFISGTLVYALLNITDRYQPSKLFLASAIAAALSNAAILAAGDLALVLLLRFFTGFFLAGIYPVGMKIAADHFGKDLGKVLGYLVGALVLGTAFPHLLISQAIHPSWRSVLLSISAMAVIGGIIMALFVPAGPFRSPVQKLDIGLSIKVFRARAFRLAAFGYFGHMWELYAFWAFLPLIIAHYNTRHEVYLNVPFFSFLVIAVGCLACIASGFISQRIGAGKTAFTALACSCACCLFSPLAFSLPLEPFLAFLFFWGWMVIADSPMFSTLVAGNAASSEKGTALTIVTCIGFFITIGSIQLLDTLRQAVDTAWLYIFLAPGPLLGLIAMRSGNTQKMS
ncbi:MAG: major facilitator superfamily protein [Chitinophagaceae bacterium]|nr:major facilitator superfamily protein [Chitinophagaceae bacterium]